VGTVAVAAGGSKGVSFHHEPLPVAALEEFSPGNGLQGELPHLRDAPMAGEAKLHALLLGHPPPKTGRVGSIGLELGRIPSVAVRALDSATGVDPLQKVRPHRRVAHDAGVLFVEVSGHGLLSGGLRRTSVERACEEEPKGHGGK
jgi:hypothetical protein